MLFIPVSHDEFRAQVAEVESDPEYIAWCAEDFEPEFADVEAARWAEWSDHHYQ